MKTNNREKKIIKASLIGILLNIFLTVFKMIVGIISKSIAIVSDAINNLSDAMSSIITIIGTKLSVKAPDKEHPYGHGRAEYLTAMIISIIIIYAGATALIESLKKIITPEISNYSTATIIIIIVAIIVKIVLGFYVTRVGKNVNSESLVDSGKDALMDSIISFATLIAAVVQLIFHIGIEAYLASVISVIIVKSGVDMFRSTLSQILGERVEPEFAKDIIETVVNSDINIKGAYDLILNDYGPETYLGSIHIEVPSQMTVGEIDKVVRKVTKEVYAKHKVLLSAVGIYSLNTNDEETMKIRKTVSDIVWKYKSILQMHGFYFDKENKIINFDIIIDFEEKEKTKLYHEILDKIRDLYPDYKVNITLDMDISD